MIERGACERNGALVAGLAGSGCLYVAYLLAECRRAVMAGGAARGDAGVVERGAREG